MKIVFLFLLFLFTFFINAQEIPNYNFRIGLTGGYGQYIQTDLKEINQEVKNKLEFETELIDDFPNNYYLGTYLLYKLSTNLYFGLNYQFHTTGSRLGAKDYSGSYAFDQIISSHSVAIEFEETIIKGKKVGLCLDVLGGINISNWEVTEKIEVGVEEKKTETKFVALRPFICPMIKSKYEIVSNLQLSFAAGYLIDLGGKYHQADSKKSKAEKEAKWNGARASLSIDYSF